jgi:hypothetical protein
MNDKFKFFMPLVKDYEGANGEDGYYHIAVAIASGKPDLQGDQMTTKALNQIVDQAKGISIDGSQLPGINMDDNHLKGLNAIVGPVTDSWLKDDKVYVDLRVRREWEETVKDLVESGVHLGGSIQGKALKRLPLKDGISPIDEVRITKAALTDTPAAWDTRGSASGCPNNMCNQIAKSLQDDKKEIDDEERAVLERINQALDEGIKALNIFKERS